MLTIQISKKNAAYIAGLINDQFLHIIVARALVGVTGEDDIVSVDVTEDQLESTYGIVTRQAEGVASDSNNELNQSILPLLQLPENEAVAGKIGAILQRNADILARIRSIGYERIALIQTALVSATIAPEAPSNGP